ncbi:hypothetical protein [Croceitalea sp. P059]|uniref:hypothetical protein n=1 Tax=Croceitalea sp. P059 TaxID=3075601 RepID=UPI002887D66B|nr:hypothetical protein [Croceitalea sp. P059]MDT0538605.1 hypothetical protein [Croceitalea sp. P059]
MRKRKEWVNHILNFIAVILGVYLAFFLNEKSTINKEIKEGQQLMNSLITDLSEDITTYEEYHIPINIKQQENLRKLIELLSKDKLSNIEKELFTVFQVDNFTPTKTTYSSMKSSGKLKLIDDLSLRKKIDDYYEGIVLESVKKGDFQVEYFTNELLKWLTGNVDLMEMTLLRKDDLIGLRNKIIVYESLVKQKVNAYQLVVEESKKLKLNLESQLK